MVIHDLNQIWALGRPTKTNPKLIVDPNTVLTFAIAFERFKPVSWRRA
jgi:hypothetical protein